MAPSATFEWGGIASTFAHEAWVQLLLFISRRFIFLLHFRSTEWGRRRIILFPITIFLLDLRSFTGIVISPFYITLRTSISTRRQRFLLINWLHRFGIRHKYVDICIELLKLLIKPCPVPKLISFFSSAHL